MVSVNPGGKVAALAGADKRMGAPATTSAPVAIRAPRRRRTVKPLPHGERSSGDPMRSHDHRALQPAPLNPPFPLDFHIVKRRIEETAKGASPCPASTSPSRRPNPSA